MFDGGAEGGREEAADFRHFRLKTKGCILLIV